MDQDATSELLGAAMRDKDATSKSLGAAMRDKDAAVELLGAAMMVYSIPRVTTQALAVFPGKGEVWRVQDAIRSWERKDQTAKYLLVANNNLKEKPPVLLGLQKLQAPPFGLKRTAGVHFGPKVLNTKNQADWISATARELKISSITLFVSPYHLLRAYLTLLKALQPHKILLIPAPTPVAPTTCIPVSKKKNAWQLVSEEEGKIIEHQGCGHVATVAELTEYLTWLWKQRELCSIRLGMNESER